MRFILQILGCVFLSLFYPGLSSLHAETTLLNLKTGNLSVYSQKSKPADRIMSYFENGVEAEYSFEDASLVLNQEGKMELQYAGFRNILGCGLPSVPARADLYYLPRGYTVSLVATSVEYEEVSIELKEAAEIVAVKDKIKGYEGINSKGFYPESSVKISSVRRIGEYDVVTVTVCPVAYNAESKVARAYTKIGYKLQYNLNDTFNVSSHPDMDLEVEDRLNSMGIIPIINGERSNAQKMMVSSLSSLSKTAPRYLIITTMANYDSVQKFANWKKSIGFNVTVKYNSSWTTSSVASTVKNFYESYKGEIYCLLLGGLNTVPTYTHSGIVATSGEEYTWETDLPYFCLEGEDNIPEIKYGRIPVESTTEAEIALNKIINYEKNPPKNSHFYESCYMASPFEDNEHPIFHDNKNYEISDGYEDRRFCQTTQEGYEYLTKYYKKNVLRNYCYNGAQPILPNATVPGPTNWSFIFSNGEPIPDELKWSNFNWREDHNFEEELEDGYSLVTYCGHGTLTDWENFFISTTQARNVKNGDLLPFILSVSCLNGGEGGKYMPREFLINPNGGGIGMIAATYNGFSGPNEPIFHGFIDALWPSPGLGTNIQYNSPDEDWDCLPYESNGIGPFYEPFDALQKAFFRLESVFPTIPIITDYLREIFTLYGDPAMNLYTENPYSSTNGNISAKVIRTSSAVSISNINSTGVVTFFNTKTGEIKSYVGGTDVVYSTSNPTYVIVTVKEPNRPTLVDKGSDVKITY